MSAARLRAVDDVPAWLFQVARHIAFNTGRSERRERARRVRVGESGVQADGGGGGRPGVLDGTAHDEGLARAIATLMPEMRDVVLLKHVAGLTFDQIAVATQSNRNTAASRYRSAMGLLEAALGDAGSREGERPPGGVAGGADVGASAGAVRPVRRAEVSRG